MKTFLYAFILAGFVAVAAPAATITISLDQPVQAGISGQTLRFFGTITNTSGAPVFLNADDLNVTGQGSTNDQFFNTVPISLAPGGQAGASSGDIELFDITIAGPVSGTYTLSGGADSEAQDNLASVTFSVTTAVPEPTSVYLLLASLVALAVFAKRTA